MIDFDDYIARFNPTFAEMNLLITGTLKKELLVIAETRLHDMSLTDLRRDALVAEVAYYRKQTGYNEAGYRWISQRAADMLEGLNLSMMQDMADYLEDRTESGEPSKGRSQFLVAPLRG